MPQTSPAKRDKSRQRIGSVDTGMRLLSALANSTGPLLLKDLAAAAEMPAAKAHRYLASYLDWGMVSQDQRGGPYDLGPFALRLGTAALGRQDVIEQACRALPGLRDTLGETCFVAAWGDHGPVIVRWENSRRPVTVNVQVGSSLPLLTSATGRVFLAYQSDTKLSALLKTETTSSSLTGNEIRDLAQATRSAGLGKVEGDLQDNISALSAPLFDAFGEIVGTLTALGPASVFDASLDGSTATLLQEAAAQAGG
ncbi:IclR family transcriptional regulator [Rhodovibrionaceae bacterium A322]